MPLHLVVLVTLACCHVLGLLSAMRALFTARSSQGSIAWVMSMITFPYVAVPLYWIFGRSRFLGYGRARLAGAAELAALERDLAGHRADVSAPDRPCAACLGVLERLAGAPFTAGNEARLLVGGQATFEAIFAAVDAAERYILVQFFIIHDDDIGRELKAHLLAKAGQGVRIYLLYDEIGSHALPRSYLAELRAAGIEVHPFSTTKGWGNRFQLNFRNHRKIVVVDGKVAFVGGLNVGDEYMGRSKRFGPWRDTHLRLEGPAVTLVQLSFAEDWTWAAPGLPELDWRLRAAPDGRMDLLVLPSGPADPLESCNLYFLQAIQAATRRLWIVSPYFVPDKEVSYALLLAAMRGVDVRIMLPEKPDHIMVYLASFWYLRELEGLGVKFFRYQPGFLHQKVIVVDEALASVGTANCDNRSFRLNFEITLASPDKEFVAAVTAMLENDFARCRRATAADYTARWFGFKTAVMFARLLSPIL